MRRLPPLTAIEAFVQVARLGSVKAASEELALSSPALSRRVQALERFIGKQLFERRHQAMKLNAEGERLLHLIAPALDTMSDAIESMNSGTEVLRLRLGTPSLFASQRLLPYLTGLRAVHPQLHLDIDTGGHGMSRLGDGLDAAIVLARDIEPTLYGRRLDRNRIRPVAARRLAHGPEAIGRPEELAGYSILAHRDMADSFEIWRTALGLPDLEPVSIDLFDSGSLLLEAAAQGVGIAFMLDSHRIDPDDPRIGTLFGEPSVKSPYSYWFVCRPRALEQRPVKLFHDWLIGLFDIEG
jgi:LysR family glycine cleavage system transcriptional activator